MPNQKVNLKLLLDFKEDESPIVDSINDLEFDEVGEPTYEVPVEGGGHFRKYSPGIEITDNNFFQGDSDIALDIGTQSFVWQMVGQFNEQGEVPQHFFEFYDVTNKGYSAWVSPHIGDNGSIGFYMESADSVVDHGLIPLPEGVFDGNPHIFRYVGTRTETANKIQVYVDDELIGERRLESIAGKTVKCGDMNIGARSDGSHAFNGVLFEMRHMIGDEFNEAVFIPNRGNEET